MLVYQMFTCFCILLIICICKTLLLRPIKTQHSKNAIILSFSSTCLILSFRPPPFSFPYFFSVVSSPQPVPGTSPPLLLVTTNQPTTNIAVTTASSWGKIHTCMPSLASKVGTLSSCHSCRVLSLFFSPCFFCCHCFKLLFIQETYVCSFSAFLCSTFILFPLRTFPCFCLN